VAFESCAPEPSPHSASSPDDVPAASLALSQTDAVKLCPGAPTTETSCPTDRPTTDVLAASTHAPSWAPAPNSYTARFMKPFLNSQFAMPCSNDGDCSARFVTGAWGTVLDSDVVSKCRMAPGVSR
jgi:hypothetical protein